MVLIPEIPFDLQNVVDCVMARKHAGQREIIVVVAEGARLNGQLITVRNKDNGDERLGGIGNRLCHALEEMTGVESRYCVLGHTQRGGSPVPFDRILGIRFGVEAVKLIEKNTFGCSLVLQGLNVGHIPIHEAIAEPRMVRENSQLIYTARDLGIIFGDRRPDELNAHSPKTETEPE